MAVPKSAQTGFVGILNHIHYAYLLSSYITMESWNKLTMSIPSHKW
jgi:hypothetical protein